MTEAYWANYCWEKLRGRDFHPHGREFWALVVWEFPGEHLAALAARLDANATADELDEFLSNLNAVNL